MSRFSIISKGTGLTLYSGTPTYTGTYMKPGMLEFRQVASPTPISFSAGDYVVYTRTGQTFRLYSTPQVKKQARSNKYGGAFIYQSVQLFDDSKQLEICPFRDLVTGDNRIHFSTQPSISTFEGVDGIARRIKACLDDMYPNAWNVRLATAQDGASQALLDLMAEAREFTVSGVNLLEALDKVYEIWPEVGWVYRVEGGKNTIVIGGGGLSTSEQFVYGKGNGLKSITRTPANADELANRIFAYGSTRNMLPRWYNAQNIKEKDSVDIQNLMIPVSEWGLTEVDGVELPDAAKAYVEDAQSIAKIGLRPKTVYFDGSGDYPEIYPTLRNVTIGDLRNVMDRADEYYPTQATSSTRVDKIFVAQPEFDSGLAGDSPGKTRVSIDTRTISQSSTTTASAGISHFPLYHYQGNYTPTEIGNYDLSAILSLSGTVAVAGIENVEISIELKRPEYHGGIVLGDTLFFKPSSDGVVTLSNGSLHSSNVQLTNNTYTLTIDVYVNLAAPETDIPCTYNFSGDFSISTENYRAKTFWVSIPQIGFDISEQAALGDGKTIAMRSGKCAGRSFVIDSVRYDSRTDVWDLTVIRSEDESLSQWFPNDDYPIESDDEFVLLDIAMPDLYVRLAEQRLLSAARELLSDTAVERWQYVPEIDAKFMVETGRIITAGQNMAISDADIIGNTPESIIVDTVSINEGEAAIPTYKVTLRDRKRKTFTEAQTPESISSTPVTKTSASSANSNGSNSSSGSSFFMLDNDGNVTLKPQYVNLWVPGWLSAGGVQEDGGGGGGGLIENVYRWADLQSMAIAPTDDTSSVFNAASVYNVYQAVKALQSATPNVSLSNGNSYSTITVNGTSAQFYTKGQVDSLLSNIDLSDYVTDTDLTNTLSDYATTAAMNTAIGNVNVLTNISTNQDGTVDFTWRNGDAVKVDLNHQHSNYVPITRTINGVDLSQNRTFYTLGTALSGSKTTGTMYGVEGITTLTSSSNQDTTKIVWEPNAGGTGIGAWHIFGNLYADGWIAAGGIGSSSSGGGLITTVKGVNDLGTPITTESLTETFSAKAIESIYEAVLTKQATLVSGTNIKTINGQSILGSGDLTIQGGGGGSSVSISNLLSTGTRVATITIDGTGYDVLAPTSGGIASESDPIFTASAAYGITSTDITNWRAIVGNYVTVDGTQTISGSKTFTATNLVANNIAPLSEQGQGSLGYGSRRWGILYSVDANLTGDLTLSSASYFDLGPIRLEYYNTSSENALHITSNNNSTVNCFVDGWLAAGGIGSGSSASGNYVSYGEVQSLSSAQMLQARTNIGVPTIVELNDESELPANPDSNTIYLIKEAAQ